MYIHIYIYMYICVYNIYIYTYVYTYIQVARAAASSLRSYPSLEELLQAESNSACICGGWGRGRWGEIIRWVQNRHPKWVALVS